MFVCEVFFFSCSHLQRWPCRKGQGGPQERCEHSCAKEARHVDDAHELSSCVRAVRRTPWWFHQQGQSPHSPSSGPLSRYRDPKISFPSGTKLLLGQAQFSSLSWQNCPRSEDREWTCGPQSLPRMQISSWDGWNQGCVKSTQQAQALARAWATEASSLALPHPSTELSGSQEFSTQIWPPSYCGERNKVDG